MVFIFIGYFFDSILFRSPFFQAKILIFTASKPLSRKDGSQFRNSQVIVSEQRNNGSLSIEKSIDLESYYCQSCVGIEPEMAVTQTVIFGCSDGFIRVFSLSTASITFAENLHPSSVLNLIVRKNFSLISLSTECKLSNSSLKFSFDLMCKYFQVSN